MRRVTYSMNLSLDGFVVGPDGSFAFAEPDEEVFDLHIQELGEVGVHLLGRRLYETMLYWETAAEDPDLPGPQQEWARLWLALPRVVFSHTLTEAEGSARLATASLADEIERLRRADEPGDIAIGGAELAAQAAELDLIDEYRTFMSPVLIGGGVPFFARNARQVKLELVESRVVGAGVIYLRHRVVR